MHVCVDSTLEGRWGTNDIYKNYWRIIRNSIKSYYKINSVEGDDQESFIDLHDTVNDINKSPTIASNTTNRFHYPHQKPRLVWVKRVGKGSARDDMKDGKIFDTIQQIFSKHFYFSFISPESFENTTIGRYESIRNLLQHIHETDVMVGLYGAGLWNSLFMKVCIDVNI